MPDIHEGKATRANDRLIFAIVVLLLTLVGTGAGISISLLLQSNTANESTARDAGTASEKAGHDAEPKEQTAPAAQELLKVLGFPPVLAMLAEPQGSWVRLEGSLLIRADAETAPELLSETSAERILVFLKTVKLQQIQSASGFLGLRDDLTEMLRALSAGEVHAILIHGLVVE